MSVALQELLLGDQASTLASAARGHVVTMTSLDRISNKKFDELDLLQAAAAKELGKAGSNPRYQPQTAPSASGE